MKRGKGAKHSRRAEPEPRPGACWPIIAIAAIGLIIAAYLAVNKWAGGTALLCKEGGGCDIVQASRYALFLGLPTALWGALLYAAIGGLALAGLSVQRWHWGFLAAVAGTSFSLYLTYLSAFEIRALCGYCLVSNALMLALLGALLWVRPAVPGRRSPVRPSRLAWQGAGMAVATVVVGAGVFAGSWSTDAAYQEALARHLTASGAVFYGAYW